MARTALREDVADIDRSHKRPALRAKEKKPGVQKGGPLSPRQPADAAPHRELVSRPLRATPLDRSKRAMNRAMSTAWMSRARLQPSDDETREVTCPWSRSIRRLSWAECNTPVLGRAGLHRHARPGGAPDGDGAEHGERLRHHPREHRCGKGKGHIIAGACRRNRE